MVEGIEKVYLMTTEKLLERRSLIIIPSVPHP